MAKSGRRIGKWPLQERRVIHHVKCQGSSVLQFEPALGSPMQTNVCSNFLKSPNIHFSNGPTRIGLFHFTVLHCSELFCTALYFTALYFTVLFCSALYITALPCTTVSKIFCVMIPIQGFQPFV